MFGLTSSRFTRTFAEARFCGAKKGAAHGAEQTSITCGSTAITTSECLRVHTVAKQIGELVKADELFLELEKTKPELAAKCREAFRIGYEESLRRSGTGSSQTSSTPSPADTTSRTFAGLPVPATLLDTDSPLVTEVTQADCLPVLMRLGQTTGHKIEVDRQRRLAEVLVRAGWTVQELEFAEHAILSNRTLLKQISYERTIGPGVFAEARETDEVRRGRLHTWDEARRYASERQQPVGELFEVVRIQGRTEETWWLLN